MDARKKTIEEEQLEALQRKPGAAMEEPGSMKEGMPNKVKTVEEVQEIVARINPDSGTMDRG